jgi:hypothetical protein
MANRFDAVLFDAGGVLVLPDPTVLGPLLERYGGSTSVDAHRRGHYAGMKAKSDRGEPEGSWDVYDNAYVGDIYTLLNICELAIRLFTPSVTPLAKYIHGTSPAKLNKAYGTPSELILAKRPNMMVNTIIVNIGCRTAQPTPMAL